MPYLTVQIRPAAPADIDISEAAVGVPVRLVDGQKEARGMTGEEYAHVIFAAPVPGVCPVCAIKHRKERPHGVESAYYQMRFRQRHGRRATWRDACAHCTDAVKETEERKHGEAGERA